MWMVARDYLPYWHSPFVVVNITTSWRASTYMEVIYWEYKFFWLKNAHCGIIVFFQLQNILGSILCRMSII
jgi:hypothetical protein